LRRVLGGGVGGEEKGRQKQGTGETHTRQFK
jgi:hypothetical protein